MRAYTERKRERGRGRGRGCNPTSLAGASDSSPYRGSAHGASHRQSDFQFECGKPSSKNTTSPDHCRTYHICCSSCTPLPQQEVVTNHTSVPKCEEVEIDNRIQLYFDDGGLYGAPGLAPRKVHLSSPPLVRRSSSCPSDQSRPHYRNRQTCLSRQ